MPIEELCLYHDARIVYDIKRISERYVSILDESILVAPDYPDSPDHQHKTERLRPCRTHNLSDHNLLIIKSVIRIHRISN